MQHTTSHEKIVGPAAANRTLTAIRTVAVCGFVLLTAACASQSSLDRETADTNAAMATATQAKAEADQALAAAQQAQATAQAADERAAKMFQRDLHK